MTEFNPQKLRSATIRRISKLKVDLKPHLPLLDDNQASHLKSPQTVASKIIGCSFLSEINWGAKPRKILNWIEEDGIKEFVLEEDLRALNRLRRKIRISKSEKNELGWLRESLVALCFAGGIIKNISSAGKPSNFKKIEPLIPPDIPAGKFVTGFQLRPVLEILAELDFYYMLDASLRNHSQIQFCRATIQSRRHALEWMTSSEKYWDFITLDT